MKKIFELKEPQFLSGIAPSSQVQDQGLWHKAIGITSVRDLFGESDNIGLLQAGPTLNDVGTIADIPIAYDTDVSSAGTEDMYILGNTGHLYKKALSSDTGITNLNPSSGIGNATNGIFVMNHSDGTKNVWMLRTSGFFKYGDLNGTPSFTGDVYTDEMQDTPVKPTHRLFDRVYFGNAQYIGSAQDDGSGGLTVNATALDFPTGYQVNTLTDDGTYLVAGVTTTLSTDSLSHGISKVIFWDTSSDSWQREWPIPDATILAVRALSGVIQVVTSRGLFACTYATPPKQLLPFEPLAYMPDYEYPTHFAADVLGEAIVFGGSARTSTFGKVAPQAPNALMQTYGGFGTESVTMVATGAKTGRAFFGTSASKLYVAPYTTNGAIRTKELFNSIEARKLKLIVNFNGGAARIRGIQVWGDPIETPTHTRA